MGGIEKRIQLEEAKKSEMTKEGNEQRGGYIAIRMRRAGSCRRRV